MLWVFNTLYRTHLFVSFLPLVCLFIICLRIAHIKQQQHRKSAQRFITGFFLLILCTYSCFYCCLFICLFWILSERIKANKREEEQAGKHAKIYRTNNKDQWMTDWRSSERERKKSMLRARTLHSFVTFVPGFIYYSQLLSPLSTKPYQTSVYTIHSSISRLVAWHFFSRMVWKSTACVCVRACWLTELVGILQ